MTRLGSNGIGFLAHQEYASALEIEAVPTVNLLQDVGSSDWATILCKTALGVEMARVCLRQRAWEDLSVVHMLREAGPQAGCCRVVRCR